MNQFKKIILITVDALRQDYLGCYGGKEKSSPFLDKMAEEGTKLEKVFATGPYSAASFPSILASIYPMQYEDYIPLPKEVVMVSEALKKKGYRCAAFLSSVYMSRYYGYDRGFDYFQDYFAYERINKIKKSKKEKIANLLQKNKLVFGLIEKIYARVKLLYKSEKKFKTSESAEKITKDATEWMKKNLDRNFFVWVHYMDTHIPYFFSEKQHQEFCPEIPKRERYQLDLKMRRAIHHRIDLSDEEINKIKRLYTAAINYVDEKIKRLADFLKSEGVYEETMIIITGDHGEEFREHGDVCHKSKAFDVNLRVPIILSKKIEIDQEKMISLIDIPSTITSLAGGEKPENWKGIDFTKEGREFVYFENYHTKDRWVLDEFAKDKRKYFFKGIRTKKYKYIIDDLTGELFFDIVDDPNEKNNLALDENYQLIKEEMKQLLLKFIQENSLNNPEQTIKKENLEKDEALIKERMRRLESLGYLD